MQGKLFYHFDLTFNLQNAWKLQYYNHRMYTKESFLNFKDTKFNEKAGNSSHCRNKKPENVQQVVCSGLS